MTEYFSMIIKRHIGIFVNNNKKCPVNAGHNDKKTFFKRGVKMKVQELARRFYEQMEWKKRDDETEFCKCKDNADENLRILIRNVHDGSLPNDWIYSEIWESMAEIADSDDDNLEEPEKEPDVYHNDLLSWIVNDPYSIDLCDDITNEMGGMGIIETIQMAQQRAKEDVYFAVLNELKNFIDEYDEELENEEE